MRLRAKIIFACAAITVIAALVLVERRYGWPEWLTPQPIERQPEVKDIQN